jgi:hypothetical protein
MVVYMYQVSVGVKQITKHGLQSVHIKCNAYWHQYNIDVDQD